MNTSTNPDFYEAVLLADYAIKTALVELSQLTQQSIKSLQSIPEYKKDITPLIEKIETAKKLLGQAREGAKSLINTVAEVK